MVPHVKPAPQAPAFEYSVPCQVVQFWELAKPLGQKACPAEVGLWVRMRAAAPPCFHPEGFVSCLPCWMFPQPLAEPLQLSSSLPCPVGLFPLVRGPESLLGIWSQQCKRLTDQEAQGVTCGWLAGAWSLWDRGPQGHSVLSLMRR